MKDFHRREKLKTIAAWIAIVLGLALMSYPIIKPSYAAVQVLTHDSQGNVVGAELYHLRNYWVSEEGTLTMQHCDGTVTKTNRFFDIRIEDKSICEGK